MDRSAPWLMTRSRQNHSARVSFLLIVSILANLGLGAAVAYFAYWKPTQEASLRAARPAAGPEGIIALGKIQPTGGLISVFGPTGDDVLEWKVRLGDRVEKGALLAVLSGDAERRLGIEAIRAQQKEATALRASVEAATTAKLADLDAEVAQGLAKADADLATLEAKIRVGQVQASRASAELERLERVKAEGVPIAEQDLLQARTLVEQARVEMDAANIQKKHAAEQKKQALAAAAAKRATVRAEADRALAQVPDRSLAATLQAAEQKAIAAELRSPISGRVVKIFTPTGDTLTGQGPAVQLADTDHMSVLAEVYETNVPLLQEWLDKVPNHTLNVEIDARVFARNAGTKQTLKGTVEPRSVAPMVARNSVFPLGPREDADRRVVEVEIRLDDASSKMVAGMIGLQVRADFVPPGSASGK